MRVFYLITGSGGSFYCANCYRDMLYLRAIKRVPGITAKAVPLYLPPDKSLKEPGFEKEVFFGAISMFLRDRVKALRDMSPKWDRILDSAPLLKLASKMSGSTNASGLEEMTLNMIGGENTFSGAEVDRLLRFISKEGDPDIIHLSNALIMGLAKQIKKKSKNVKIVCSLLNEDDWIEDMPEPFRSKAWTLIGKEAGNIDKFLTPSNYYKDFFVGKTGVDPSKIEVVPIGFDPEPIEPMARKSEKPSIGFFCRLYYNNGFDKLVDAFIKLKESGEHPDLTLSACGGFTAADKPYIAEQVRKLKAHGLNRSLILYNEFTGNKKAEFLNNVDIISVPVHKYDGYGLYILEANSAGIPVVLPATGAFPEIVENTGGGIVYSPDTVEELTESLSMLLKDKVRAKQLGEIGRKLVKNNLSMDKMTEGISDIYMKLVNDKR